jgi:hypothetical protein
VRYDGTSNPIEFLQLYVIAVQAAHGFPWPSRMLHGRGS